MGNGACDALGLPLKGSRAWKLLVELPQHGSHGSWVSPVFPGADRGTQGRWAGFHFWPGLWCFLAKALLLHQGDLICMRLQSAFAQGFSLQF